MRFKIIVVDWEEGSKVGGDLIKGEKFKELQDKLFEEYKLGEDFKVISGYEMWISDNIICDQCLDIRQEEELANFGGHCSACETAWV